MHFLPTFAEIVSYMKCLSATIITTASLFVSLSLFGATRSAQMAVEKAISESACLKGAVVALMAVTTEGDTLAALRCDDMLVPASNMKLITTGAALKCLGPDYRFKTGLAYDGDIRDGVLDGDLVILGGFDPTFASTDTIATPVDDIFESWYKNICDAGISAVAGMVVGDLPDPDIQREDPRWQYEDIGTYYGTGVSPLSFCDNVLRLNVTPGLTVGDTLTISQMYPQTPWMHFCYDCTTGEKGTGDNLYLYTNDFTNDAVLKGTYGLGANPKTLMCSNKMPELTCAGEFSAFLDGKGMANMGPAASRVNDDLTVIGEIQSPALSKIVKTTNYDSNNFFAESIFRTLGLVVNGSPDIDSSREALETIVNSMGLRREGFCPSDGSGLSRNNYVSPAFFCKFLSMMSETQCFPSYLASIPRVGVGGTVKARLARLPQEQRGRVYMKSGSMSGIRCYSGYILPKGKNYRQVASDNAGLVSFSVMVNNCSAPDSALRAALDDIISQLVSAN